MSRGKGKKGEPFSALQKLLADVSFFKCMGDPHDFRVAFVFNVFHFGGLWSFSFGFPVDVSCFFHRSGWQPRMIKIFGVGPREACGGVQGWRL